MHFDSSFALKGAGAGVVLTPPTGETLKYIIHLDFKATNNVAEYEGLLAGLRAAAGLGVHRLIVKGDSQLVVNQVNKDYQCSDPMMAAYLAEVRKLERHFLGLEVKHVLRRDNQLADELARISSSGTPSPGGVFEERLSQPSVSIPVGDEGGTLGVGRVPGDPPPAPVEGRPRTATEWPPGLIRWSSPGSNQSGSTYVVKPPRKMMQQLRR